MQKFRLKNLKKSYLAFSIAYCFFRVAYDLSVLILLNLNNIKSDYTDADGGELFIGGNNPEHFTGSFTYINLTAPYYYWQIAVDSYISFSIVF